MRLMIAMMKHETNTFSPVPTPLSRFGRGRGPIAGDAAIAAFRGTGTAIGAYLELAEQAGAEIVVPCAGDAAPSGLYQELLQLTEAALLADVMQRVRGNRWQAARWLGLNRATVRKKLGVYGLTDAHRPNHSGEQGPGGP